MTDTFIDPSSAPPLAPWAPFVLRRPAIEAEIERLLGLATPGRRESLVVHPEASAAIPTFAPGIRITLSVLRPGEVTPERRANSTAAGFCLSGSGTARIGDQRIDFDRYDVWNVPGWRPVRVESRGAEPVVWLTYTNAPILEALRVHVSQEPPDDEAIVRADLARVESTGPGEPTGSRQSPFGTFQLPGSEAQLMPYERLISPPSVPSVALHWPWQFVQGHLDELEALGADYVGRRLYLMYNPATGRTNGTTPSFFATITRRPPGIKDRPHRHVSAAINYFFHGSGFSIVDGQHYEWSAGDLMYTAPGWVFHGHASNEGDHVYELTIQDQPLHIASESLLWQEDPSKPPRVLGAEGGFDTNREAVAAR